MSYIVRHPLLTNLNNLDKDELETIRKYIFGPRNGINIKKLQGRKNVIRLKVNDKKRLFFVKVTDADGQKFLHFLGRETEGVMEDHNYKRNAVVRGDNEIALDEIAAHYKGVKLDIEEIRKEMENLSWEKSIEEEEGDVADEAIEELLVERIYYLGNQSLQLTDNQEEALFTPGALLIGPGGSGKTTVGTLGMSLMRERLKHLQQAKTELAGKKLYYVTLQPELAAKIKADWHNSFYPEKNDCVEFCSYEELTLHLHKTAIGQFTVAEWTDAMTNAKAEDLAKFMKQDVFYITLSPNKLRAVYRIKDHEGKIHQGEFSAKEFNKLNNKNQQSLSLETINNCRHRLIELARAKGHIEANRLACTTREDSFQPWLEQFFEKTGRKIVNDHKMGNELATLLRNKQGEYDAKKLNAIYQEFRIISGFEDVEKYLEYSHADQRSNFPGEQNAKLRRFLFQIFACYQEHLFQKKQCNLDFYKWPNPGDCAGCFLDEAQDMTLCQLQNIRNAMTTYYDKEDKPALLGNVAVGSNQDVHGLVSSVDYIKKHLSLTEKALPKTHRCPPVITGLINRIVHAKLIAMGRSSYDGEDAQVESAKSMQNVQGSVKYFEKFSQNDLDKLVERVKSNANFIVVTPDCYLEEARKIFGISQVFAASTIKGLEFDDVLLFNPLAGMDFSSIDDRYQNPKILDQEMKAHRAKGESGPAEFAKRFNELYVGASRSKKNLTIYQPEIHNANRLRTALFDSYKCTKLDDEAVVKSTDEDWIAFIKKVYQPLAKDKVAYEACLNVFVINLRRKKEDFLPFLISIGLEKAPETLNSATSSSETQPPAETLEKTKHPKQTQHESNRNQANNKKKKAHAEPQNRKKLPTSTKIETAIAEKAEEKSTIVDHTNNSTLDVSREIDAKTSQTIIANKAKVPQAAKESFNALDNKLYFLASKLSERFTASKLTEAYNKLDLDVGLFFRLLFTTKTKDYPSLLSVALQNDEKFMDELITFITDNPEVYAAFSPELICKIWQIKGGNDPSHLLPFQEILNSPNGIDLLELVCQTYPNFGDHIPAITVVFMLKDMHEKTWERFFSQQGCLAPLVKKQYANGNRINTHTTSVILSYLLEGELYECLFGGNFAGKQYAGPVVDKNGDTLLHYCIKNHNYHAVRAITRCSKFLGNLLHLPNNAQKTALQLAKPKDKNNASEIKIAMAIEDRADCEIESKKLYENFTKENLEKICINNHVNKKPNACETEYAAAHFAKLFARYNYQELAKNTDNEYSGSLLYHVLNDEEKSKTLISFLKLYPWLLDQLFYPSPEFSTTLVKRLMYGKESISFIANILTLAHVIKTTILFNIRELFFKESLVFIDRKKLEKSTWQEMAQEDSLLVDLLKRNKSSPETTSQFNKEKNKLFTELLRYSSEQDLPPLMECLKFEYRDNCHYYTDKNGDSIVHFLIKEGYSDIFSILEKNDFFRGPELLLSKNKAGATPQILLINLLTTTDKLITKILPLLINSASDKKEEYQQRLDNSKKLFESLIKIAMDMINLTHDITTLEVTSAGKRKFGITSIKSSIVGTLNLWTTLEGLTLSEKQRMLKDKTVPLIEKIKKEEQKIDAEIRRTQQAVEQQRVSTTGFFNRNQGKPQSDKNRLRQALGFKK